MSEEDGTPVARETAMGKLTVYYKDEPGPKGYKAGTSKMEYTQPPPRNIPLRKKHRKG